MPCGDFEELLLSYGTLDGKAQAAVDAHVAQCAACREFFDALRQVDDALTLQFAGREVTLAFANAVEQRIQNQVWQQRPSWVPEILDFVGWGAIVTLLTLMAWWLGPQLPVSGALSSSLPYVAATAFLAVALLISLRSFADLKH